jgi:hypothetical protein
MAYLGKGPSDTFSGVTSKDSFTGDGSTVNFDISTDIPQGGDTDIFVYVDNVRQEPGVSKAYTTGQDGSGNYRRITFTTAPDSGAEIYVLNPGRIEALQVTGDNSVSAAKIQSSAVTTAKINDAAVTTAKLGSAAVTNTNLNTSAITGQTGLTTSVQGADTLLVYDDSETALKKITLSNVLVGQTELTETPANDDLLLVYDTSALTTKKVQKSYLASTLSYSKGTFTGDGSTTTFTITAGRAVDNILVFVNGICLVPTDDYTISSTTLTFATAPTSSAEITVRYLPI